MIFPNKHSHPDQTVVGVSVQVLKLLRKRRLERVDDLVDHIRRKISGGDALVFRALGLLYLLGMVEYRPKTDSVEIAKACE